MEEGRGYLPGTEGRGDEVQVTLDTENLMRTMFKTAVTGILAIVLVGMVFVSDATAQCASLDWLKSGA